MKSKLEATFNVTGNSLKKYLSWTHWLLGGLVRTKPGESIQLGLFQLVNVGDNMFRIVVDEGELSREIESLL
jgi:hypothetical protein